jgi:hypothetical protein
MENLIIKRADNGFVLEYYDEEIKDKRIIAVEDVEQGLECISDARLTQKLLFEVQEFFNLWGSKHSEERCYVVIKNQKGEEIDARS